MKNILLLVLVVSMVVGGGSVAFWFMQNKPSSEKVQPATLAHTDLVDENTRATQDDLQENEHSSYQTYSSGLLERTTTPYRVLFFYANWCPTCRPADESFTLNSSKIPAGFSVIRVNYNDSDTDQSEKDLARKYGVTYQHTYVQIDEQGNEVTKWNGGAIDELLKNLRYEAN